ncbi:serine hydrolase domain-containing protein [Kribbella kalugense]|uniref:D-alanyl-D-alanine carboxypeptidase n=1 Tax=Kribbella kalugense TaxID=2512221 RepID=A0A4R7ZZJ7_9ACTN|nr:serine hydrolase domain-containing protein [Kribbella kalugense]TDW23653.1 D-alanyl-D-alanine carboxypeptidase [Kribbella kalugense]
MPIQTPSEQQDRPELRKAAEEFVDAGFGGLELRVHDEQGEWVGSAGVRELGSADEPPLDGQGRVGSVTKTFVSTVVLQLVAEGKLELDGPVAPHLARFELDPRITVRMLLNHTSGLFNYTGEYFPDGTVVPGLPATGKDWAENRLQGYAPEELVEFALSKPSRFEPGAEWSYANTNYTIAALLIEAVTGRSFTAELEARILKPLDLTGTLEPGDRTDIPDPHSHGYFRYSDGDESKLVDVTEQNPSLLFGAGSMLSTVRDLHVFMSALQSGQLLPAELLAEMRTPEPKSGPLNYGLGLFAQDTGSETIYHHNGSAPGGYGALVFSSADGTKTLTALITMGDADVDLLQIFPPALDRLVKAVF